MHISSSARKDFINRVKEEHYLARIHESGERNRALMQQNERLLAEKHQLEEEKDKAYARQAELERENDLIRQENMHLSSAVSCSLRNLFFLFTLKTLVNRHRALKKRCTVLTWQNSR